MVPPRGELARLSDRELVIAFQSAHSDAYEEIFRRHGERVRRVCLKMLRDPHDAEEATQETFLRGYRALGRFNGRYQLGAWLARIATNVCLDEIRKSKTHVAAAPVEEADAFEDVGTAPSELIVERTEVARSMGEIAPLHAKALMLQAVEGLSHKEMAGELEMTAPQVKSLLHRARRSFRAAWQEASGWMIAPLAGLRSLVSRNETRPAGDVTAGATMHAGSALVERIATGTFAAVIAISGLTSGTAPDLRGERPRPDSATKQQGSLEAHVRRARGRTGPSSAAGAPLTAPPLTAAGVPAEELKNSLDLGDISADDPEPEDGGPGSGGRTIDTGPTVTGQEPVDQGIRRVVDLANDTIEAGSGARG